MKKNLFIILFSLTLPLLAQTKYPSNGVFVQCDFNNSIKDNQGVLTFPYMKDSCKIFVAGADGTPNGALRFGFANEMSMTHLTEPFSSAGQSSLVITFKINNLMEGKEHAIFFNPPRKVLVNDEGKLRCIVRRAADSDKKDIYDFDLGIKPGEWVTLAVLWDHAAQTTSCWANGKYGELENAHSCYISDNDLSKTGGTLMGYCEGDVDEFILYNRLLTEPELQALCGKEGQPFEKVEAEVLQAKPMVNWKWAAVQLIFAVLCIFIFNRQRKRLSPVTAETIRDAHRSSLEQKNVGISELHDVARDHLWNAFSYWKEEGKTKEKDPTWSDMQYVEGANKLQYETANGKDYYRFPMKKKYMQESLNEYKKALQMGSTEPDIIEGLNLYVSCYNAAHKRVYNGKWWVIAAAVACVYIHGLIPGISLGLLDSDQYVALPDGFFAQMGYFTKYLLPGVIFSAIAYCAASFGIRYQERRGKYVMPKELGNETNLKDIATYAGKPLLGSLAAMGAVGLGVAAAIYGMVSAVANAKMDKVIYKDIHSGRILRSTTELSSAGMGSIMFALLAFAVVIMAVYLVSSLIISLFSVAFIYKAIKNYIVRT